LHKFLRYYGIQIFVVNNSDIPGTKPVN